MNNPFKKISRFLSIVGFSILSGMFGFGLTWLAVGFYSKFAFKTVDDQLDFAGKMMPALIVGGILGFIIGIIISIYVAKRDLETERALENKYVGVGGRGRIYAGAPISIFTFLTFFFGEKFLDKLGDTVGAYSGLGIFLLILIAGLILRDHLPQKLLIPIGIIGWLLTFGLFIWFGFFGPGSFGYRYK